MKQLRLILSLALVLGAVQSAGAQTLARTGTPKRVTQAERQAAATRAKAKGFVAPSLTTKTTSTAGTSVPGLVQPTAAPAAAMAAPGSAPHYFSVPNYANSPLTLTSATVAMAGNPLQARAAVSDSAPDVLVVGAAPITAAGFLTEFQTYAMVGSGPQTFRAYVLRPTGTANVYTVVSDSGPLNVPSVSVAGVQAFPVTPIPVQPGDLIAHYGQGIPFDVGGTDTLVWPASAAPAAAQTITIGSAQYPTFPQGRTYSLAAKIESGVALTGNSLSPRANATDGAANVMVVNQANALGNGVLTAFQTYAQPGSGPNTFHAFVLRPGTTANSYSVIFDTGPVSVPSVTSGQVLTVAVPPVVVSAGDVIAHYGQGIPYDAGVGTDALVFPADVLPTVGQSITLGAGAFPLFAQPRAYSIAAKVQTITQIGMRKFVDTLPGLGAASANNLGQYIPVAVPDTTTYPGSDYYEIAVVEYAEQMHSDLPATKLRGYVQLSTAVVPGAQVTLPGTTVYKGVDKPHYLGPAIAATKDRPVRILFRNLLPTGQGGNLFLPVDTTVMGAGMSPNYVMPASFDPQAPDCGAIPKPVTCFSENRATLHLHGGITPWISDGTPHQWITPAGEKAQWTSAALAKGVSVQNVPDMPDPGPGAQTFFYTNQQSARLLFYHDHAWGITRLNVYAGEAAPYLITDPAEQALVSSGTIPADQLALVVQDKTFVPPTPQLEVQDPLWDLNRWGGVGQLWVPHVYVPAQNPGDSSGVNAYGRWAYGPWFWPPTVNIIYPPKANPYYDPNCNPDLTWCEPPLMPGTPYVSMGMESFNDTPLVNGTAYPTVTVDPKSYRMRILNAANDRFFNLQLYVADSSGTEVALKAAEVQGALTDPTIFPTPDTAISPEGPQFIQIGTEGGFLPSPVVVPNQPITWVTDPTVFNAGNVDLHALLLGPAERADVVVDFSAYAGKTLILYNDAPAAFPARDPRYDYYTGNPDLTETGGAPSTLPGFGPNTRTVMQIKVAAKTPAAAFDLTKLQTAFAHNASGTGVFESSQNPIVVGQGAYNAAYGTAWQNNGPYAGLVQIFDTQLTFDTKAGNRLTMPLTRKAIQDEMGEAFEQDYGRMSGNLGLEAPNAQAGTAQRLILYPYINPPTEIMDGIELPPGVSVTPFTNINDGTQIWKITHNGVDTHPIHFHLFDVQLVNRVGWDGIIRKPELTEIGWKDTVRISPLEDTIVVFRPIIPKLPFGVPDSVRPLNPAAPLGSTAGFVSTDPNGNPITPAYSNVLFNFGWEYVWHCHILSHEEMDMMHPYQVNVTTAAPANPAPSAVRVAGGVQLTWTDGTAPGALATDWGNPASEYGFRIERATLGANGNPGTYATIGTALANTTTFTDTTAGATTGYSYRVTALVASGGTSGTATVGAPPPSAPTTLTTALLAGPQVRLTFNDTATNETGFIIQRQVDGGAFAQIGTAPARNNTGSVTYTDTTTTAGHTYVYRVAATNSGGPSAWSNTATAITPAAPAAPTGATATPGAAGSRTITAAWTDASNNETGFTIQYSQSSTFANGITTRTVGANVTSYAATGLQAGRRYYFRVRADNGVSSSAWSNTANALTP